MSKTTQFLLKRMQEQDCTFQELSRRVGMGTEELQRKLYCKEGVPVAELLRICDALHVELRELVQIV